MRTNDGRVSHPVQDMIVSVIVVAMVTMVVLPDSPASGAIKTLGEHLSGAIKDVVGRAD